MRANTVKPGKVEIVGEFSRKAVGNLLADVIAWIEEGRPTGRGNDVDVAAELLGEEHVRVYGKAKVKKVDVVDGGVVLR